MGLEGHAPSCPGYGVVSFFRFDFGARGTGQRLNVTPRVVERPDGAGPSKGRVGQVHIRFAADSDIIRNVDTASPDATDAA